MTEYEIYLYISLSLSLTLSLSLLAAIYTLHTHTRAIIHLGLDHDFCITKMRQLTLTSLAVEAESGEVPFSTLLAQLDMPQEELELFLIDGMLTLKMTE